MLGVSLFAVGAVLFINGLWLLNKISDKEIIPINLMVGILSAWIAFHNIFASNASDLQYFNGAHILLFSATYLWVAYNRCMQTDGRGLGWFSLFVAISVIPVGLSTWHNADSLMQYALALNWFLWSLLWLNYFLLLTTSWISNTLTGYFTLFCAIFTGWIPGLLLLHRIG